jgi:hypothetical protein
LPCVSRVYGVWAMARAKIHTRPHRTNVLIDRHLHREATNHAVQNGYGSFSQYVARLVVADLQRKRSAAEKAGRTLEAST